LNIKRGSTNQSLLTTTTQPTTESTTSTPVPKIRGKFLPGNKWGPHDAESSKQKFSRTKVPENYNSSSIPEDWMENFLNWTNFEEEEETEEFSGTFRKKLNDENETFQIESDETIFSDESEFEEERFFPEDSSSPGSSADTNYGYEYESRQFTTDFNEEKNSFDSYMKNYGFEMNNLSDVDVVIDVDGGSDADDGHTVNDNGFGAGDDNARDSFDTDFADSADTGADLNIGVDPSISFGVGTGASISTNTSIRNSTNTSISTTVNTKVNAGTNVSTSVYTGAGSGTISGTGAGIDDL